MKVSDFDFHLPESLIALEPKIPRDSCRLMVLHRNGNSIEHRRFYELSDFLSTGDLLLLNDTRVFPARLTGKKETGGKMEILLVKELEKGVWEILSRGGYTGKVRISETLSGDILEGKVIRFCAGGDVWSEVWNVGEMPLPPYIRRAPSKNDREWYQTVYADNTGSIAAPTAGLHFTERLIEDLGKKGVQVRSLTLHVGVGTFKPVRSVHVEDHRMDMEYFEIAPDLIATAERVKKSGNRVVAVGTTATRAMEGYFSGRWTAPDNGSVSRDQGSGAGTIDAPLPISGYTDIFIRPGYEFKVVDAIITNFHLPRSTPLMLTSAFCGTGPILEAYRSAMAAGYRFFSYGDAMLIL